MGVMKPANIGAKAMDDSPDDSTPPADSPIRRALAQKKAALEAKAKPPRGGKFQREQAAAHQSNSKSKPWMGR
jgi:hypothetical protein